MKNIKSYIKKREIEIVKSKNTKSLERNIKNNKRKSQNASLSETFL